MEWQVQEAKQRFSELLRRSHEEGPQVITRHGEEVAVMVDIQWYRAKTSDGNDLATFLSEPHPLPGLAEAVDEARALAVDRRPFDPFAEDLRRP